MVLVKATDDSEAGYMPEPWAGQMMAAMGRFNDELRAAGILVMAGGLAPTTGAVRVVFDGETRSVQAGPFANPQELVAGFWLWDVKDMDEALAWAKRCPNPMPGPSTVEIRPLHRAA